MRDGDVCREKAGASTAEVSEDDDSDMEGSVDEGDQEQEDMDSDTEWYRQEVGEEPDEEFKRNVRARNTQIKVY